MSRLGPSDGVRASLAKAERNWTCALLITLDSTTPIRRCSMEPGAKYEMLELLDAALRDHAIDGFDI